MGCLPTPVVMHMGPNMGICHSTFVGNMHPPKVYAHSCQTVCITDEENEMAKGDKGEMFLHYSEGTGKNSRSDASLLKEPSVMCHLTLQYNETNLYIHIMLLMTSLTYEIKL